MHRNIEIQKMSWDSGCLEMKFLETGEPNLWRIVEVDGGECRGLMSIYVHDALLAGEDEVIEAAKEKMDEGDWRLSPAEWATEETQ